MVSAVAPWGAHLWADHFDGSLEEVFQLQNKIAVCAVGVIEPTLQASEIRRSAGRPTRDLTSYDFYLRALANFRWMRKEQLLKALDVLAGRLLVIRFTDQHTPGPPCVTFGFAVTAGQEDPEDSRRKALGLAEEALALADDDPGVLANVAHVLGTSGEDINTAMALVDRCVSLNPSYARGW